MLQQTKEKLANRKNSGFTLMELLIVIAIIAVLVAIAIPTFAAQLDNAKDSADKAYYETECQHASEREVIAADAERTSIKYKLVEYMQDKVGMEFDGRVSGVTEWGMYVEIEPSKVEGMVSLREIRSDFFEFDEEHYRLVGKRTHKVFRLGDRVRIRVKNANLEQRLLDYELIENLK